MIKNIVAYSNLKIRENDFNEIKKKIDEGGVPELILFFSSADDIDYYSAEFVKEYPNAVSIGSSTCFFYSNEGFGEYGLSALAVYDGIEVASGTILDVSHYPLRYAKGIDDAVKSLSNTDNTVCLEFTVGHMMCEELVQDTFRSVLESLNIPVVGGTAGAEAMSKPTAVALNGNVYSEACVYVLIKNLGGRVFTYKENIYKPTNTFVTATDVDCDDRIVYEFDDKNAASVMSAVLNLPLNELKKEIHNHPLGRVTGKDIYITEANTIMPDGSINYFARIYNRTKLVLMELDDLDKVWEETARAIKTEISNPQMCISVNCFCRAMTLKQLGKNGQFNDRLSNEYGRFIGMAGFGEQTNYEHFNQTMVMLVFE